MRRLELVEMVMDCIVVERKILKSLIYDSAVINFDDLSIILQIVERFATCFLFNFIYRYFIIVTAKCDHIKFYLSSCWVFILFEIFKECSESLVWKIIFVCIGFSESVNEAIFIDSCKHIWKGKYYIERRGVTEVIALICFAINWSLRERVSGGDLRLEATKE